MIESIPLYEMWKIKTVALLGINADAVHIYAGVLSFLVCAMLPSRWLGRRFSPSLWMLVPGFLLSLLVEALDYRYWMQAVGYFEWQKSFLDVVNTNLLPAVLLILLRSGFLPKREFPVSTKVPPPLDSPY